MKRRQRASATHRVPLLLREGRASTHRSNYLHTLRALQVDAIALGGSDVLWLPCPCLRECVGLPFAAPAVGAKLVLPGRHTDGASLAAIMRDRR